MKGRCECVYELAAVKRAHILAAVKQKKKARERKKKPLWFVFIVPLKQDPRHSSAIHI